MTGASLGNRGRLTGGLLILLGAWGAVIPFVGPYFGYAYTPDKAWAYTSGRLWLSILPGAAAFIGGFLVLATSRMASTGAFLAALGGAWFVIGQPVTSFAINSSTVSPGTPVASSGGMFGPATMRFLEGLGFFYGLGVVILFLAAVSLGEVVVARAAMGRFGDRMTEMLDREDQYGPAY